MMTDRPAKVIIVDDEPLARERMRRLIQQLDAYEWVADAENGSQALTLVREHSPDIVLMDIRMPLMDGLTAARQLGELDVPPAVIFCTAYNDHAVEAFDANAVGYLMKPVNRDKLAQALSKAQILNKAQINALDEKHDISDEEPHHFSVKTGRGIELIAIDDICYFLADSKYVSVFYRREGELAELLIDEPLKELEGKLRGRFIRLHRNALVAIRHIKGVERIESGFRVSLNHVNQGPLVSRRHMPALRKLLQQL